MHDYVKFYSTQTSLFTTFKLIIYWCNLACGKVIQSLVLCKLQHSQYSVCLFKFIMAKIIDTSQPLT